MSGAGCATKDRCDPAALSLLSTWTSLTPNKILYNVERDQRDDSSASGLTASFQVSQESASFPPESLNEVPALIGWS